MQELKRPYYLAVFALFLMTSTPVFANNVNLTWDPNTELIQGYKIYRGTASRTYGPATVIGNTTTHTVTGLGAGTYYFAVTTFDSLGNESGFSNEISTTLTCTYSLSSSGQSFSQATGSGSVVVTASTGCNWTAASNASWIAVSSGGSGSGNGTVNFSVAANTGASRTGTLTIAGLTFTVTQAGISCTYSISPGSQSFGSVAGTGSVAVTASIGCNWSAASNASWITISSGSTGSSNGTVNFSVAANSAAASRSGTLTIAGQTFTVTQAGITCTYSISPSSQSFGSSAGTGSVAVTASTGCNWTAASNATWITISSGSSGSSNGTVNFSVAGNTAAASHTGTLTIAGQTFTVTQTGIACTYSISPGSQSFGSVAGTGNVAVTAATGCNWTAASNSTWITIPSGSTGSSNGTVNFSVAANTAAASRTGTSTIAGQTFSVTQSGISCSYSISPTSQGFSRKGGIGSVAVTASTDCSWTAVSNENWITITLGSNGIGNGTVKYLVAAKTGNTTRTGTLTIAGQTVVIMQKLKYTTTFSQFASGADWVSTVVLINPSSSETTMGSATFLNQEGDPVAVSLNGQASTSVALFTLPPLGSVTWTTNGAGELVSGSVRISADIPVTGVVKYSHPEFGIAGLGESYPSRSVMTSVVRDASRGSNTGIALSNPHDTEAELTLSLKGMDGVEVNGGSVSLRIRPNGNTAKFIHQLFPKAETKTFQGTLIITSITPDGSVCATALQIGSSAREFNSMPVVAVDPAPTTTQLFFAQFVNGANWTSSLDLVNPLSSTNSGVVSAFRDDGSRWATSLNGQALSEDVSFQTQPQGNTVVRTDGQGNLIAGWARVTASGAMGGVLTFASPELGIAAVGPSIPMAGFIAPMMRSDSRQLSTGVAIASVGSAVRVNLSLRNQAGELVAGGEAALDLPPNGHVARFIEELFPSVDTREFEGTLTVTAAGDIIGTAIQIGRKKGELTSLPVTQLR